MMEPGTELSSIIWKKLQQEQIQAELDQSHNISNSNNNNKGGDDDDVKKINLNPYFKKIDCIYNDFCNNNNFSLDELIFKYMLGKENTMPSNEFKGNLHFKKDTEFLFTSLNHFIDCRKSKNWVEYVLSDNIKRYGTTAHHPIFPSVPGWLIDVLCALKENSKLYLIYATDIRGVDKWLGHFCSVINISNLLFLKTEKINNMNATLILLHVAGLLTPDTLSPINRQGMKYPRSILQKATFENVRAQLLALANKKKMCDNLCNFVGATIACVPHRTGTNSFNLINTKM